jgi:hypothetical protein
LNKENFYKLLDKYIAGEATKEEEQRLLNFYGSFKPSNKNVLPIDAILPLQN